MESSYLVIFSTSGKFNTKFNVLCCIRLSDTLFWTGARGRIPITLNIYKFMAKENNLRNGCAQSTYYLNISFQLMVMSPAAEPSGCPYVTKLQP